MRRVGLIAAALGAAVVGGALWWILSAVIRLEQAERRARVLAAHEERVRLALWRMDSALATFLSFENALPVEAADRRPAEPPFQLRRFELAAGAATTSPASGAADDERLPSIDALLAALDQPPLDPGPPPPPVRRPPRRRVTPAAVAPSPAAAKPAAPEPEVPTTVPVPKAKKPAGPVADDDAQAEPSVDGADPESEELQARLNVGEFAQRNRMARQQAVFLPTERAGADDERSLAGEVAPRAIESRPDIAAPVPEATETPPETTEPEPASAAATDPATSRTLAVSQVETLPLPAAVSAPAPQLPPAPTRPSGPTGVVRALEPVWLDERLVLTRRIVRDGAEALQGLAVDDATLRAWLLDQVRDLLPDSRLEPADSARPADPGRQLALLPFRLVPGPPPAAKDLVVSPARIGVLLALASIVAVALGAGVVVLTLLRLARQRTAFASAVIHELRTPLTTFRLYTDLLAEGAVPESDRDGYLATLRSEGDRLGHLVENVLAYARLEPRQRPRAEPFALAAWLEDAAARLGERAARDGVEVALEVKDDARCVYVAADPLALERILHNLCDNTCRYAAEGGRAELILDADRRRAILAWRDHGPGLPRHVLRRRRSDRHPTARTHGRAGSQEGIGLGLDLCRRLARQLGGRLRLRAPDGDGALIELSLPTVAARGTLAAQDDQRS